LFSQPQLGVDTLVDLETLGWPAFERDAEGLTVAATCRNAELMRYEPPTAWPATRLFRECCTAFLASFKIWNASTVGGNVVMSLPAGPIISLTAALDGVCTLWPREGAPRQVSVVEFVTGDNRNVLAPGELLRSIRLPAAALQRRSAFRHVSLTKLGRSAALVIGTVGVAGDLVLTVTAATDRPVQLRFPAMPGAGELRTAVEDMAAGRWFHDVHGTAEYKRHVALHLAEEIRAELAGAVA